jgi:predicted transcriptional regulator
MNAVTIGWSSVAIRRELKEKLRIIGRHVRLTPTRQVEQAITQYIEVMAEEPEIAAELDRIELVKPGP